MTINSWPVRLCLLLVVASVLAIPGFAQNAAGIQAGVSASPDQFYIGGHVAVAEIEKNFWFRPGADVGFGNSATVFTLNGDFVYNVDLRKNPWTAYFGGGPALVIATFHRDAPLSNNTDVGPGFHFLAGIRKPKGIFAEIKVGLMDSPEFKLGIGYSFR
jgi:hypothetical protein